jgi:HAD superfamily hydrolase (TIGR01509 family)
MQQGRKNRMYVIFDMDGVISDTEAVYLAGYLHAAKLYGLPEKDMREAVVKATGVTDANERRIMTETFAHLPQFDLEKTYRACRDYFTDVVESGRVELKPGALQILRALKESGVPVGLASSSPRAMIEKVLGPHGVLPLFDTIVSGDAVERGKPDPEIFVRCAAQLAIPVSKYTETYVIEDSYNGIRAAHAAGMKPVMVPDQLPPTPEMREKAVAILPSLMDVMEWMEKSI